MSLHLNILGRLAGISGAFAVLATPLFAEGADFSKEPLVLLEAGVFCPIESTAQQDAPNTERGFIDIIEGDNSPDFTTTIVPGELDMGFGIRYMLAEGYGTAPVLVTTLHPPFGEPPVTREEWINNANDEFASMSLFRFDDEYEIALGEWTFELSIDGETLVRQTFFVIPPEDSVVRLAMCKGPAILS